MILTSTLSTFHSFPATYRPVLHMVYISQLIRYATCCSHYCSHNDDFRYCHKCLVDRLLSQGYIALRLEKSFKKFYGRYQDIIEKYQRSVKWMIRSQDSLYLTYSRILVIFYILHWFVTRICKYFYLIASCDGVMYDSDDACSIWSTWSCYWLDQFLTLALHAWILSKFVTSLYTICFSHFSGCWASFVYTYHSILECCNLFSGVGLRRISFCFIWSQENSLWLLVVLGRTKNIIW